MARRHRAERRDVIPDAMYGSELVGRLVNVIMQDGKKATAQRVVYGALDRIKEQQKDAEPLEVLTTAIDNIKPRVEVKSRRVGGATYQVPLEVSNTRGLTLALRWLVQYAQAKRGTGMARALASEVMDAFNNQGNSIKKRDDTHKMAQANKAFAHYRW